MRFWNNLHHYVQSRKLGTANNLKGFGSSKPKGLNRIAKIGYGHLCLREENIRFNNNLIIKDWKTKKIEILCVQENPWTHVIKSNIIHDRNGPIGFITIKSVHHTTKNK